jgi:hypothetical protein
MSANTSITDSSPTRGQSTISIYQKAPREEKAKSKTSSEKKIPSVDEKINRSY